RGIKVSKVFPNCAVAAASHHSLSLPSAASSLKREPSKNLFRIKKLFVLIRHVEASLLREGNHPKDGGRSDAGL
ncbi:MAG: hypothetical protein IJ418_12945, partial [Clostridia bacterium]|nr:hypothetical protein [Clostridia bacterium]